MTCPAGGEQQQKRSRDAWSSRFRRPYSDSGVRTGSASRQSQLNRKLFIPLVFAFIGGIFCWGAVYLFPSRPDVVTPASFIVTIQSRVGLYSLSLDIGRTESSKTIIDIGMVENKNAAVRITIESDIPFACRYPTCRYQMPIMGSFGRPVYPYHAYLEERNFDDYGRSSGLEVAVNDSNFGFASNGITALAMIPDFDYQAPGSTVVTSTYNIPRAASYDWSTFPSWSVTSNSVTWSKGLAHNKLEQSQEVIGTNRSNQQRDDRDTFLSGAFVGVGGAALIGALQEGLHLWSDDPARSRRRRQDS